MSRFNYQGFSLIELMVVMAIMASLMTLTGGLVLKTVDQQQRVVELEKVQQLFQRLSYSAYYSGYDIRVMLDGHIISIESELTEEEIIELEQLTFEPQEFLVSTRATILPEAFKTQWHGEIKEFKIKQMYNSYAQ
ncbi:hypothetical protein W04_1121 [Pseudoalteromonas sp. SW0106-04]|uniref:type II secretion system protein n=1 Tax=Pseudoalteromonas sp. SW0106-04 TaxID=1702169 RepID=UPI0006B65236|nr:type II secretion system protein [Pseudoalteromonas sp. SW0106-04]GAP74605.1 hypothetical protein W04_1121 [Pseudoalteromonas sp. SW0106-04]